MARYRLSWIALLCAAPLAAQEPFDFYARGPYRAAVPRPSAILGYEPGAFHTTYGNMERVIRAIAEAAPDRVRVMEYGRSEERRTLYLLAVSAPENLARLEAIRARTARLADPRATTPAEATRLAETLPATVWLNYANDGNETAAFEAAMHVLWHYAATDEPASLEVLRQAVILISPAHNPESHQRFVAWYNAFGTGAAEPAALEHDAPWGMSTNNNHYQIDLNRDALAITQRETQALVRAFLRWNPQVFVDHHGETSQYFFPPPALPVNPNIPPQTARWMEIFGRANAEAFDRHGWPYYVRDVFDLHYPGYWDSWPALNGATGMTYETDAGGDLGLAWRRDDGSIATFRGGIAKHVVASLATVETAARHRAERLRDFYAFRRSGIEEVRREALRRVVLVPARDPRRAAELVEVLLRAGIEVRRARAPFASTLAHDYLAGAGGGRPQRQAFPAGAYVVDLAQPQKRLARALLEPSAALDDAFIREQLARRARNARRGEDADHEDYQFYDVTAWALPYTFGVEAWWTEDAPEVAAEPLALPDGAEPAAALAPAGGVIGGRARSAYLFPNDRNGAGALAFALLSRGYRLRAARRPLRAAERSWPRGTFVALTERNPETLHDSLDAWARGFGVEVTAVATAWTDSGAAGPGGEEVAPVHAPRILVAAGEGVSTTEYGALWFLLERTLRVPFTPIRTAALADFSRLHEYNVLIFPHGSPDRYRRELGEDGVRRLGEWIRGGGAFVAWGGGARFAMHKDVDWTSVRLVGAPDDSARADSAVRDTAVAPEQRPAPPLVSPTAPEGTRPLEVPGAIFRASLDLTHWLTYGYERETLPVLLRGDDFFRPSRAGANPVVFTGDSLVLSGFVWPGDTERLLRGTAWAAVERRGEGHVVLFADSPIYRLFWRGTTRLLQNALLFGPGR